MLNLRPQALHTPSLAPAAAATAAAAASQAPCLPDTALLCQPCDYSLCVDNRFHSKTAAEEKGWMTQGLRQSTARLQRNAVFKAVCSQCMPQPHSSAV
jgi:hypothetical protein